MGKALRLGGLGTLVVAIAGVFALSGGPAVAVTPTAYTCTGGAVPSGTYASVTITGACQVKAGTVISVLGNVNVGANAVFDAQSYSSTITVGRNVIAGAGSLLGLGCLPGPAGHPMLGHLCGNDPTASSDITIDGSITATDATAVLLNGITVKGNVTLIGSEGTATATERYTAIPWSIKLNTIGGNLSASNMTPIWIGVLHNNVGGNVTLTNIYITDGLPTNPPTLPADVDTNPTIQVALNTIGRNLNCFGLAPAVAPGAIPGESNNVGGNANGQCAGFNAVP